MSLKPLRPWWRWRIQTFRRTNHSEMRHYGFMFWPSGTLDVCIGHYIRAFILVRRDA